MLAHPTEAPLLPDPTWNRQTPGPLQTTTIHRQNTIRFLWQRPLNLQPGFRPLGNGQGEVQIHKTLVGHAPVRPAGSESEKHS